MIHDEARDIERLIGRIQADFPDTPAETVRDAVMDAYREFAGRPIREFIPIFVEREVHTRFTTGRMITTDAVSVVTRQSERTQPSG